MESARTQNDSLTPSQRLAVAARGNVLVMAGAGTGKTKTLVARCLDCLDRERASLDELLIVTFTEAAAAEMRLRLRRELEKKISAAPDDEHWPRQLALFDIAHIGTLHSFCLQLVREHFHELGLDPQLAMLDEGEARQLAHETLDEIFQNHYAGEDEFSRAVQNLIQIYGNGRDEKIRTLVLRLHNYSQTRPDATGWLADQLQKFSATEPTDWQNWLLAAIADWRNEWLPVLENLKSGNEKAAELAGILLRLPKTIFREAAAEILKQVTSADGNWPVKRKTILRKPLETFFDEANFLSSLASVKNGNDPLAEDWNWVRDHMAALLRLAQEFAEKFSDRKRADGVLDFHDLEQFALKLLWSFSTDQPTAAAENWRKKLRFIFVDEYQDINAAQDKIIAALSRDAETLECADTSALLNDATCRVEQSGDMSPHSKGNRFLVGDVKQSIYRFRLADPKIFRDYAKNWHGENGQTIPLSENFRSRESLLNFTNSVFRLVMREEIGGVNYDADAELKFGAAETRAELGIAQNPSPRVELLLRQKSKRDEIPTDEENSELADLEESAKEARLIAQQLKKITAEKHEIFDDHKKDFRAADFGDMAILLRSPRAKAEIFAKEFERAGVPLSIARGGFYDSSEILDLLSLLELLDNPLQDVPCIAVLRSPLVGLSLAELAEIRLALKDGYFWTALTRSQNAEVRTQKESAAKIEKFLTRFSQWRQLAKQVSLSQCLEKVLAETYYADWLKAQPRGEQRAANVERFLQLAQQFDQFQRQGLFRFLKFIAAQREIEAEPEVPAIATQNAVRLMSIHQSKGLEFPVVVVADLAKNFNEQDLHAEIILDETFGLCPRVKPPESGRRYPSLPHWLAQKNQKRELRGEELRLLYVAFTRARDTLILSTSVSETDWAKKWNEPQSVTSQRIAKARSFADWLALWFSVQSSKFGVEDVPQGEFENLRWRLVADEELVDKSGEIRLESISEKSRLDGVSPHQVEFLDETAAEKLRAVLSWEYPHFAATQRKAKSSVTELRRAVEETDDEAEKPFQVSSFKFSEKTSGRNFASSAQNRKSKIGNRKLSAAEIGAAHHKFLQHVSLVKTNDLAAEADRLTRENFLSADERGVLNLDALAQFWDSSLGKKICAQSEFVRRELPFTARFSPAEIAKITGEKIDETLGDEFVVVQGVADLVVLLPQEIWLVDFKTDAVRADELDDKIKIYKPQLQFYAAALEKIFARKVTTRALHFLNANKTIEI
jgi:ATP-dependent helicase/nuclease subunit A